MHKEGTASVLFIWLMLIQLALFGFLDTASADETSPNKSANQQKVSRLVRSWQEMFGPVDFARQDLFQVMLYAWPQPTKAMKAFGDKKLSTSVVSGNNEWMRSFFKKPFRPDVTKLKPTHYFWGGFYEPDLLRYEWQAGKVSFRLFDNSSMILIMPEPQSSGLKPANGVTGKSLATFLLKILNIPYASPVEVTAAFKLPEKLKIGDVFTNAKRMMPQVARDWRSHIVGFVGKDGISIICFKASYDEKQAESAAIYTYDPPKHWLDGNLTESDGKTQVKSTANE